jgi:hypothetical protein
MCGLVGRVPWSETHLERVAALLLKLLRHWVGVLARDRQLSEMEHLSPGAPRLDGPAAEGFGLLLLASSSSRVRRHGLALLEQVRMLARHAPAAATLPDSHVQFPHRLCCRALIINQLCHIQ